MTDHNTEKNVYLTIRPGDFGSKYRMLDGRYGAHQRPIDSGIAARYGKTNDWQSMFWAGSRIVLAEEEPDVFWILDGQHRLYAAEQYIIPRTGIDYIQFPAQIRPVHYRGMPIADQVRALNSGKAFSSNDSFHNVKGLSPWPAVFERRGVTATYRMTSTAYSWAQVIRASRVAVKVFEDGAWNGQNCTLRQLNDWWLAAPAPEIARTAEICAWWAPVALHFRKHHNLNVFYTALGQVVAHLIYESNRTDPRLAGVPEHMIRHSETMLRVKGKTSWGESRYFFDSVMGCVNYRRPKANQLGISVTY